MAGHACGCHSAHQRFLPGCTFHTFIDLFDQVVLLVIEQDEPLDQNFPRKHYLWTSNLIKNFPQTRLEQARYRMFGAEARNIWSRNSSVDRNGQLERRPGLSRVHFSNGAGMPTPKNTAGVDAQASLWPSD